MLRPAIATAAFVIHGRSEAESRGAMPYPSGNAPAVQNSAAQEHGRAVQAWVPHGEPVEPGSRSATLRLPEDDEGVAAASRYPLRHPRPERSGWQVSTRRNRNARRCHTRFRHPRPERSGEPRTHMWTAPFPQRSVKCCFRSLASICTACRCGVWDRWPKWGSRRSFQSCRRFPLAMGPSGVSSVSIDRSRPLSFPCKNSVSSDVSVGLRVVGCDLCGHARSVRRRGQGWPQATAGGGAKRP
jgi:hypothetical protein